VFPKLTRKADLEKAKKQLTKYFSVLNDLIKADLLEILFNCRWESYRQKHRTILDKDMLYNDLCCTYPEECSGRHGLDLGVNNLEFVMLWKILVGKSAINMNLLPFLDQYHNSIMVQDMMFPSGPPKGIGWDNRLNLYRDIEQELIKNTKFVANVHQIQFFATYRGFNSATWGTLLQAMPKLQSLELHYWVGDNFFDIIRENCSRLRELILFRQRQGRTSRDLERIPGLVSSLANSLKVLIIDSVDSSFDQKTAKDLQKAVAGCKHLECLKLEADESPYVHWVNSRYRVNTKLLILTLRRSYQYLTIVRNINRCFNNDVEIQLTFDTYVDIDNHKHAFFSHGPITGGGENTVAQSTKDFEQAEVGNNFYKLFSEFGPKVTSLHCETDIRPEYIAHLFPNLESLEMFSRATRRVPMDSRFSTSPDTWKKLSTFTMEVDPGFSSFCTEYLLVHILGDVFTNAHNLSSIKVLASQTGLKVSEFSLMLELNKVKNNVRKLREIQFLSPYRMQNQGISCHLATWFLSNCPQLELLRDVCSWGGGEEEWARVVIDAEKRGLKTAWADKTRKVSLYTIDYDSEGWVQTDTGHQFELYNNLNDDWEVVDMDNPEEMEDVQVLANEAANAGEA